MFASLSVILRTMKYNAFLMKFEVIESFHFKVFKANNQLTNDRGLKSCLLCGLNLYNIKKGYIK